jgi:hypothetical protein
MGIGVSETKILQVFSLFFLPPSVSDRFLLSVSNKIRKERVNERKKRKRTKFALKRILGLKFLFLLLSYARINFKNKEEGGNFPLERENRRKFLLVVARMEKCRLNKEINLPLSLLHCTAPGKSYLTSRNFSQEPYNSYRHICYSVAR